MGKGKSQNKRKKSSKNAALERVNLNAAGIDIGSKEHYVAVPEGCDEHVVKSFKCYTPDLHDMARWLKNCGVDTVAMESTGCYWIPVFQILEQYGLEVKLVDARKVKNVPGRKTDVLDCQWLQQLHTFGLLEGAFIPDKEIRVLRGYWRHRSELVSSCAKQINLMQKALEQMNIQLHKVLSDITGVSGMQIIRAIIQGEKDPVTLAKMSHPSVRSSHEEIAKALTGDYRAEHLFALKQSVELYDFYQEKIAECDRQVERYMKTLAPKDDSLPPISSGKSRRRKNQPHFDLKSSLYQMTGVDLTLIDGIDAMTAQTIISECGFDMSKFASEKHFASWLGLCPNPKITGGKVIRKGTKKIKNRAADAFRLAAQSLHSSKSYLGAFYRRMRARLGSPKAITATAHKLARLFYRMLKYGQSYVDKGQDFYEQRHKARAFKNLRKRAKEMGYMLCAIETGEMVSQGSVS